MLAKAVGKQLTCVFVDHGLLRKNEGDEVEAVFGPNGPYDLNFIRVNAGERYFKKLAGIHFPIAIAATNIINKIRKHFHSFQSMHYFWMKLYWIMQCLL